MYNREFFCIIYNLIFIIDNNPSQIIQKKWGGQKKGGKSAPLFNRLFLYNKKGDLSKQRTYRNCVLFQCTKKHLFHRNAPTDKLYFILSHQ